MYCIFVCVFCIVFLSRLVTKTLNPSAPPPFLPIQVLEPIVAPPVKLFTHHWSRLIWPTHQCKTFWPSDVLTCMFVKCRWCVWQGRNLPQDGSETHLGILNMLHLTWANGVNETDQLIWLIDLLSFILSKNVDFLKPLSMFASFAVAYRSVLQTKSQPLLHNGSQCTLTRLVWLSPGLWN